MYGQYTTKFSKIQKIYSLFFFGDVTAKMEFRVFCQKSHFLLKLPPFWAKKWVKTQNFKKLKNNNVLFIGELNFFRFWGQ